MERALDPSAIVVTKMSNLLDNVCNLVAIDFSVGELSVFLGEPGFRDSAEIEYYFNKLTDVSTLSQRRRNGVRKYADKCF